MENQDKARFAVRRARIMTSTVDVTVQQERDQRLKEREEAARGKRGQPPMTDRLATVRFMWKAS